MGKLNRRTIPLCACGCLKHVTWNNNKKRWNVYLVGHNHTKGNTGKKQSEEFCIRNGEHSNRIWSVPGFREKRSEETLLLWQDPEYAKKQVRKLNRKNI